MKKSFYHDEEGEGLKESEEDNFGGGGLQMAPFNTGNLRKKYMAQNIFQKKKKKKNQNVKNLIIQKFFKWDKSRVCPAS